MNELIDGLLNNFEDECSWYLSLEEKDKFKQAIQTACQAQRNACARRFQDELDKRIHGGNSIRTILNAEITKEDYE